MTPDAPIQVTFDRPMDHDSVTSRFRVQPAVPGCSAVACVFNWSGQTLTWKHAGHEFIPGAHYQVTVRSGFRDQAGLVNTLDHAWDFTVEDALSLRSSNPTAGAVAVAPEADISLQFSRDLVVPTAGQVHFEPDVPSLVSIDPSDPTRLTIAPTRLLEAQTQYRLVLDAGLQDAHHDVLGREVSLTFTTGPADLSRSLAFAVLDADGTASRLAMLRTPATVTSPVPSLRLLYSGSSRIAAFGWSGDGRRLYVLEAGTGGRVQRVSLSGVAETLAIKASSISPSPVRDELAYVDLAGALHLWAPDPLHGATGAVDTVVPQAGDVAGSPAWSGDGRRLALPVAAPGGGAAPGLAVLERGTLTVYAVPGVLLSDATAPLAWSFDGTALAFPRSNSGPVEVWVYRPLAPAGSGLSRAGMANPSALAWSNDGSILYADTEAGLMRAPGRVIPGQVGDFALLPSSRPGDAEAVTPSFDRRVAMVRAAGATPQLWLMNTDGSGLRQVTFAGYDPAENLPSFGVTMPRWAPS